jgi:hypothetical protein
MASACLVTVCLAKGQFTEAVEFAERGASIAQHPYYWTAVKACAYGFAGRRDDAARLVKELKEIATRMYISPQLFALTYLGMGETESWREMMQVSLKEREYLLVYLRCASWNDPARSEPFFKELVRKVGLP